MPSVSIPKIAFPFTRAQGARNAVYREQDTDGEIQDCVEVLLRTTIGEREEVPSYGIPDYVFRESGANINELYDIVNTWEQRAHIVFSRTSLADLTDTIRVSMIEEDLGGN